MEKKINIGFLINFSYLSWIGGFNYFLNFFNCLNLKKKEINIIIFTDHKFSRYEKKKFKNIKIIQNSLFSREAKLLRILSKLKILLFGRDKALDNFFENKIDLLSHSGYLGSKSVIPSLPIIWDFQEIHNKNLFSFKDRVLRKFNTLMCSMHANKVILGGNHCHKDYTNVLKNKNNNGVVLSQPAFIKKFNLMSKKSISKKFNIFEKKFFYLPNQFWFHKNHLVVLKALKYAKEKYRENLCVISSGLTYDRRFPNHFENIKKYIDENKLHNNFIILNTIKFDNLLNLMCHAIALINPSKSEGWSNTVEQGKSLEKKIILSKIPSHIEQKPKGGYFFNCDDYKKLTKILIKCSRNHKLNEIKNYKKIKKNNKKKAIKFAGNYLDIVKNILIKKNSPGYEL
jgi:glycosyltransferase involved in cell wall biosynthesis